MSDSENVMASAVQRKKRAMKHKRRVLWLLRRAARARKPGASPAHPPEATLARLKDSGRPLLFAGMPRMLQGDGRTVAALENKFRHVEEGMETPPLPINVSRRQWLRALTTSGVIARRRLPDRRR